MPALPPISLAIPPVADAADHLPLDYVREPVRVLIASLAPGGAERIVIEWLAAEAAAGRVCELAVLHRRRLALASPPGVKLLARGPEAPERFIARLAQHWSQAQAPVSTHLIGDDLHALLWRAGVRTVPVVHNAPQGWRNDPRRWNASDVPLVVACAGAVRVALLQGGCQPPIVALRHRPALAVAACDPAERRRMRREAGIDDNTFVILAVGAVKPQKDYRRAVDVLAELSAGRDAVLVIAGGVLDADGLAELDAVMDRAVALGVESRLRLPGFVDPVAPWFSAADMLLNVSRYEGLSMAVREALAAGLPVVATDVGGQRENPDAALILMPPDATAGTISRALAPLPVRTTLAPRHSVRLPRIWSLTLCAHRPGVADTDTLFVTANLNAGGAQRSLVNLAVPLAQRHRLAVAVVGRSTQAEFAGALTAGGVQVFRCAQANDTLAAAEALLAWAARHGVKNLCFWNVDARIKLLVARFAPPALRLIDVSPGHYAFEELEAALPWADAFDMNRDTYFGRLDELVFKYRSARVPAGVRCHAVPNGVATRPARLHLPAAPRFLVSGRIAPSKHLSLILEAFREVCATHATAELHVVGSAEPRHAEYASGLMQQAAGLPVVFRGARPQLDFLAEPFAAAVVLGTHQGSPNAVLEAMAAGIPVIANASGGSGEIVIGGANGWLLAEDCTVEALAQAMREAVTDTARNLRFGQAARCFVQERHAIEGMVEAYLALFENSPAGPSVAAAADLLAA